MVILSSLSPPRRRWAYAGIAVLGLLLIAIIAIPLIVDHVAKTKLKSLVRDHMNATLAIGGCSYSPPYSVTFRDLNLITQDQSLLTIDRLKVNIGSTVMNVVIGHPVLNLPADSQDSSLHDLFRTNEQESEPAAKPASLSASSSQRSQQWRINLNNAEVIRGTQHWKNLDLQTQITSESPVKFSCALTSGPAHSLALSASGTIDLDQKLADIRAGDCSLAVSTAAGALDYLPDEIRQALRENHIAGAVHLRGSGQIPLQHPEQSTFAARFDLTNGHADNPIWPAPLDEAKLSLELNRAKASDPVVIGVRDVLAASGPTNLEIHRANFTAYPQNRIWAVTEVAGEIRSEQASVSTTRNVTRWSKLGDASRRYTVLGKVEFSAAVNGGWPAHAEPWPHVAYKILAYPQDASFVVPSMEAPIQHITGGPVLLTDDHLEVQNLSARYGYDLLQIAEAQLRLNNAKTGLGVSAIDATMRLDRHSPRYPEPVGQFLDKIHPQGPFHATGRLLVYSAGHEPRGDYAMTVNSPDASFVLGKDLFPIDHAKLTILADTSKTGDGEFRLTSFSGSALGGTVGASAEVKLQTPIAIAARANFSDVDVKQAYASIASHGGRVTIKESPRLSGKAAGDVYVENTGTDWQTATGGGTVEITGGNFGNIPILSQLGTAAHFSDSDFVGSEAAAVFTVSEKTVHISNVAVSAPAIGIQGDGFLKFAGAVHLHVVVAPLADWRQKLKSTGIPLLGNAAGAVQTFLNRATRTLFYEFNVTGDIHNPIVTPVPVPLLTKGAGRLFTHMLSTKNDQNLLDLLKPQPTAK